MKLMKKTLVAVLLSSLSFGVQALFDPTQPSTYVPPKKQAAVKKKASLRLESVLISSKRKIATINGKLYQLGDRVGRYQLKEIQAGAVVLKKGQQRRVLKLVSRSVKK